MKWGIKAMKLKTSFINQGILRNDLKRFTWIGVTYLLLLLASVPLKILMWHSREQAQQINYTADYIRIFQFDPYAPTQIMIFIIVPVVAGLLLFRYLQDGRSADMAHALPVSRGTHYSTHVTVGIILLFAPLIITALVSWLLVAGLGIEAVNITNILNWLSNSLLINLLFFISTAAVGMVTGMTALQGALSYVLLLLPSGLSYLLLHNLNQYTYGFALDYYASKIENLSPLFRLSWISSSYLRPAEIAAYLGASMVLFFVGRSLYRLRNSETAGSAISFTVLQPIFKYAVTFCFMLLIGSYFNAMQDSVAWTYFGYFIGSLLAYFLMEILLNKSVQVFRRHQIRGYGIYALVMVLLLGLFHFDWTGYEKRLPEIGEVAGVYMDASFHSFIYQPAAPDSETVYYYSEGPGKAVFTDQENIAHIYALHQQIIAHREDNKKTASSVGNRYAPQICLAYELPGGKHLYRQYGIDPEMYAGNLKPIYESREYKELHNAIFHINPAEVDFIEISGHHYSNKKLRIIEPEAIAQVFSALQADIYDQTYEEIVGGRPSWASVEIRVKNRVFCQDWKKSYTHLEQWLKDSGNYEQARLMPELDLACAYIDKFSAPDEEEDRIPRSKEWMMDPESLAQRPGVLKITDPDQMEWCLREYYGDDTEAAYEVFFVLKNSGIISGYLKGTDAPAFIRNHSFAS